MYVEYVENKNSNVVENYILSRKFVKLIFLIELIKTWFFSNYLYIKKQSEALCLILDISLHK